MAAVFRWALTAYRAQPLLVQRKAEFSLLIQGVLGALVLAGLGVHGFWTGAPWDWAPLTLGFLAVWTAGAFLLVVGRLEAQVNLLGLLLVGLCGVLLPQAVSRTFFSLCLFSLLVLPVLAVRPYQAWATFAVFPGLILVKGVLEILQPDQGALVRDTREQTILTLLVFLGSVPVIRSVVGLVGREIQASEVLLQANQTLKLLAGTDQLTGIWNRRHFDQLAQREFGEARRTGRPLALGFLDLDRFKEVNDQWGHQVGDEVLAETVRAVQAVLRQGDSMVRWGGDEFVVLCPGVGPRDTAILGRKILETVQANPALNRRHQGISLGLALWDGEESVEELLDRADQLLYRAKAMGRNRACLDTGDPGGLCVDED